MRKPAFCICENKTQISFAVTAKLISTFVFATWIVQFLYFLNPKFQASRRLLWLYSPVCVGPGSSFVSSEDSYQPGHPPSLISLHCPHLRLLVTVNQFIFVSDLFFAISQERELASNVSI